MASGTSCSTTGVAAIRLFYWTIQNGILEVKAIAGDTHLGGEGPTTGWWTQSSRKLGDLSIGPVLSHTAAGTVDHTEKLLRIPGAKG